MTKSFKAYSRRVALGLAAALSGGSVFGACEGRFKDAFVEGTTSFIRVGVVPSLGAVANSVSVTYTVEPFSADADDGG